MKKIALILTLLALSIQAHALNISDSRQAGLVFGFLMGIPEAQILNSGKGTVVASADITCTSHETGNYYCMADIGGLTGDIAESLYNSFSVKTEEEFDGLKMRQGTVVCASVQRGQKAPQYTCH